MPGSRQLSAELNDLLVAAGDTDAPASHTDSAGASH
jgi:hypothetical protein